VDNLRDSPDRGFPVFAALATFNAPGLSVQRQSIMNILFVADPLEAFKVYKDTTFSMMREAQRRGHRVIACEPADISWRSGGNVHARVREITLTGSEDEWFVENHRRVQALADFDAVIMRKDPPFDSEYFYATHLLEQAEREGARVFNKPASLRDHPEKLAIMEFAQYVSPTLVTRDAQAVRAFHDEHRDIERAGLHARQRPCAGLHVGDDDAIVRFELPEQLLR